MYLRRDEFKSTVRAPAKLNVFLEVLGRRDDGFHELETLIVPVRLWDSLSMEATPPGGQDRLGEIDLSVRSSLPVRSPPREELPPAGDRNLVVRALELLRARSGCRFGAHVELIKRIPLEAGMGGGSSDAAAALLLANRIWRLGWDRERLATIAAELGSDVPFFIHGGAAVCRGRGELVESLGSVPPLYVVIVKPPFGLSTESVYQAHDHLARPENPSNRSHLPALLDAFRCGRLGDMGRLMANRLQSAAASLAPWVDRMRSAFERLDCLGHQLSGSGSAYFGICRHAQHARRAATILRARQLGLVYATRSYC
jgi:4-diphosphocytidyl-2-C-methyl-D-erythritol kinase